MAAAGTRWGRLGRVLAGVVTGLATIGLGSLAVSLVIVMGLPRSPPEVTSVLAGILSFLIGVLAGSLAARIGGPPGLVSAAALAAAVFVILGSLAVFTHAGAAAGVVANATGLLVWVTSVLAGGYLRSRTERRAKP